MLITVVVYASISECTFYNKTYIGMLVTFMKKILVFLIMPYFPFLYKYLFKRGSRNLVGIIIVYYR